MYADVTENTDRTNHSSETCPQCGAQFVTIDRRQRFCSVGCARIGSIPTGEKSPHWKGGRIIHDGYVRVRAKQHPRSSPSNPYVFEHILVIEDVLGRQLLPYERVHHKNGRRDDNRPENLELWRVKDPPGVCAADYHCFGCLCSRAQAAAAHSESPESPGAGSRISTGDIGASATGLNELQFAARPVVEHGECAWCHRRFEPKTDTQRCCSRSCARYYEGAYYFAGLGRGWRGGRVRHSAGYIWVFAPTHPRARTTPYVFEHILVMERILHRR